MLRVPFDAVGIMTYTAWFDDEPSQEPPAEQPGLRPRPRASLRLAGAFAVGFAGLLSAGLVAAWAIAGIDGPARVPAFDEHAMAVRAAQLAAEAASDAEIPPDPAPARAAALSLVPNWLYDPNPLAGGSRKPQTDRREIAIAPAPVAPSALPPANVPLPPSHPLSAAARQQLADAPAAVAPATGSDTRDRIATAPVPARNPLLSGGEQQVAALPPPASSGPLEPPAAKPQEGSDIALPGIGDKYAIYDIKGKTVYMPSGERLEAHSGYGDGFDNIQMVTTRMVGPTPPNTYMLSMRERLFHGVQALRMRPVGEGKMYGRDGFLTHSYLMGDRGDSNGCVSFKDYDKFLAAYKRGEVTKIIVVSALANPPPPAPDANPLLAWLSGKGR